MLESADFLCQLDFSVQGKCGFIGCHGAFLYVVFMWLDHQTSGSHPLMTHQMVRFTSKFTVSISASLAHCTISECGDLYSLGFLA